MGEHLLELYAARNKITAADLRGLNKLLFLDLADNKISSLEYVHGFSDVTSLTQLVLQGNPVASTDTYHTSVLRAATSLTSLDGYPCARMQQQQHTEQQQNKDTDKREPNTSPTTSTSPHDAYPLANRRHTVSPPHPATTCTAMPHDLETVGDAEKGTLWKEEEEERDPAFVRANAGRECLREEEGVRHSAEGEVETQQENGSEGVKTGEREAARESELEKETKLERERAVERESELEREKRRSKGLQLHLADTMRLLTAERHTVEQHEEKERAAAVQQQQQQQHIAKLVDDTTALQLELHERDHQIRSLRAYLSTQSQADAQVKTSQNPAILLNLLHACAIPLTFEIF